MCILKREFNKEKTVEVLHYVIEKLKNPTLSNIYETLYFADWLHGESFERSICNDSYVHLRGEFTPFNTKNIIAESNEFEKKTYEI